MHLYEKNYRNSQPEPVSTVERAPETDESEVIEQIDDNASINDSRTNNLNELRQAIKNTKVSTISKQSGLVQHNFRGESEDDWKEGNNIPGVDEPLSARKDLRPEMGYSAHQYENRALLETKKPKTRSRITLE